jgi:ADP-dependent NAD(P)H-hydrate dehydratase / NAD(P)H-hydrate epimerase
MRRDAASIGEGGLLTAVTSAEMRAIDRAAIDRFGVPGLDLMERAGTAVAEFASGRFRRAWRRGVLIVAGKGNNGGDALVVARRLRAKVRVEVVLVGTRDELSADAAANLRRLERSRFRVTEIAAIGVGGLVARLGRAGLVIDGLFGTGLRSPLDERSIAVIDAINAAEAPVLAIDVPSGLDADRGVAFEAAVQATATVTFAFPKVGLLTGAGVELGGELVVADIGIPAEAVAAVMPKQHLIADDFLARIVPPRERDTHKGTYGHVLVVGGSRGKSGAVALAGRAALRAGAGLTTVASAAVETAPLLVATPELMAERLAGENGEPGLSEPVEESLGPLLDGKTATVLGPGLGTSDGARRLVRAFLALDAPALVLDADGLNCAAGRPDWLARRRGETILTPHPGEMARLVGGTTADVQADRVGAARRLAQESGAVIVLKGARTVIAAPKGRVAINPTGNPGMASGGMGDALAGIAGSLVGRGIPAFEAACAAVYWHGLAADRVALRRGESGLLATDVIEELPVALAERQAALFGEPG